MKHSIYVLLRRSVTHGASFAIVLAVSPLLLLYMAAASCIRIRQRIKRVPKMSAAVYLSPAASVESLLNKTGSLDILYNIDAKVEMEFVDRVLLFWHPAKTNLFMETNKGWTIFETREFPLPFYRLGLLYNLFKIVRQSCKYDIVFIRSFDPYFCGMTAWLLSKYLKVPYCISIHCDYDKMFELDGERGAPAFLKSRRLAKRVECFTLSRAKYVIAITGYIRKYAVDNGARDDAIAIFRHPTNTDLFWLTPAPSGAATIAMVSRLSRQKYILDLAYIAKELDRLDADCVIEVAGDGETRQELEALLNALGVLHRVRLLGFLNQAETADLLRRSCLNLCLVGGRSLIESGFTGRPSVAYDWEWHDEVVIDGETGCLVPEGDWRAAAAAVSDLLQSPTRMDKMGAAAYHITKNLYSEAAIFEQRRLVYGDLVKSAN